MELAGAENVRVTGTGGRLEVENCDAPEVNVADEPASPTTNCLIFSLAFAFKTASSIADCDAGASENEGRGVACVL